MICDAAIDSKTCRDLSCSRPRFKLLFRPAPPSHSGVTLYWTGFGEISPSPFPVFLLRLGTETELPLKGCPLLSRKPNVERNRTVLAVFAAIDDGIVVNP
mgnify:CR=1 FL=1